MGFSRLRWAAVLAIPAVLIGIGLVLWFLSPVPRKPIHVTYPQEGTLFPNDIVPPLFAGRIRAAQKDGASPSSSRTEEPGSLGIPIRPHGGPRKIIGI